jgi:TfoX/Sxy family transcriptional regulator of competence genes
MPATESNRPERKYRDDVLAAITDLLADRPEATPRGMFGHPGFAVGGKMFACLYDDGVAVKLPEDLAASALSRPHVEAFRPYGKSMRQWVLLVHDDLAAYTGDLDLFEAAIAYVAGVASQPKSTGGRRKRQAGPVSP